MRTFQERIHNINLWVEIINHHWQRLEGDIHNDCQTWNDTLHAMTANDHWDWVEVEPALRCIFPEIFRRYRWIEQDTHHMRQCLQRGEPLIVKYRPLKNRPCFRAWMTIKDIINEINGEPTRQYKKQGDTENG